MAANESKKRYFGISSIVKVWNRFFYRNPKGAVDPDSQWKLQNELQKDKEVYNMVGLAGGGTFVEEYDKGTSELEKKKVLLDYFAREVVPNYLCDDLEVVTENDYQTWHNKQHSHAKKIMASKETHAHFSLSVLNRRIQDRISKQQSDNDSVVSLDTITVPYQAHTIKWKLDFRGAIGETPMHLLFLNGSPKHIRIAEILLEACPKLARDVYEGYEYYGESCLHFAVIQENLKAVKILLATGEVDLHSQARGKFFIPVNVKRGDVKLRKHKFEGYAYYGEYPLSFAASTGNKEIYNVLIDAGCDPTKADRYGNNVLHLTVIHDQPDMYYHVLKHPKAKPHLDQCNHNGLTPLALAAKLGKKDMFNRMLAISSRRFWSYNKVTCSAFPLKSLDTIGPEGETDWNSALMMIIRGRKGGHLDLVSEGVINELLNKKWKKFGQAKFIRLLIGFIIHLLCLSLAVYFRPNDQSDLRYGSSGNDITRYVFEGLVTIICVLVFCFTGREIYLESLSSFFQNLASVPSRSTYLASTALLLACVPIRFLELYNVEEWLLAFAVPGLWSYLSFFLRNSSLTGPFITMIFRIFSKDMLRFSVIYLIILMTSSIAFFYQYEGQGVQTFLTEGGTVVALFQMSFGEFDYLEILQGKYQALSILMFVAFMIMVHILLLNMLIAMITRTFEKITKQSEKVWVRQWASMVVSMERSHSRDVKIKFQRSYDMDMQAKRVTEEGDATGVDNMAPLAVEDRGLMIVHHQTTTESQRREITKKKWQIGKYAAKSTKQTAEPLPKLQIKSQAGLADMIHDAPDRETVEGSGLFERTLGSRAQPVAKLNYSDDEEDDGT